MQPSSETFLIDLILQRMFYMWILTKIDSSAGLFLTLVLQENFLPRSNPVMIHP